MCVCVCICIRHLNAGNITRPKAPQQAQVIPISKELPRIQEFESGWDFMRLYETLWDLRYFEDSRWMSQKGAQGAHVCDVPWGFSRSFISRNKRRVRRMRATRMTCRRDSPTMYVTCMWHVIMWHVCVCAIMKNPSWKEIKAIQASWCFDLDK